MGLHDKVSHKEGEVNILYRVKVKEEEAPMPNNYLTLIPLVMNPNY